MDDQIHKNIDNKVNEDELYNLDKISLDNNKKGKRAFERKLKTIYDTNRPNGMNFMHDKEVNKIMNPIYYMI